MIDIKKLLEGKHITVDFKTLPYYKIEKTKEGKEFFFSHIGYFNFWDEYLIVHTRESKGKIFHVLVNRPKTKFNGATVDNEHKKCAEISAISAIADSVCLVKPEEMFKDFPELVEYNEWKVCSKYCMEYEWCDYE